MTSTEVDRRLIGSISTLVDVLAFQALHATVTSTQAVQINHQLQEVHRRIQDVADSLKDIMERKQ